MANQRVVCAGYTVMDAVVDDGVVLTHRTGGTAANVAANLAWLGASWVDLGARLGDDPAGRLIRAELQAIGVGVSNVELDPAVRTPVLVHEVSGSKEPRYLFTCPACGQPASSFRPIAIQRVTEVSAPMPSAFFFDRASAAALSIAEAVRSSGGIVMFEPNGVGREPLTIRAIKLASIVKISSGRGDRLMPLVNDAPRGQLQISTEGSHGLVWRTVGREWRREKAYACTIVDSAGAGDWVSSGFLRVLTERDAISRTDIRDALDFGQAIAALSCEHVGARGIVSATSELVEQQMADRGLTVTGARRSLFSGLRLGADVECATCLASPSTVISDTADLAATGT